MPIAVRHCDIDNHVSIEVDIKPQTQSTSVIEIKTVPILK